MNANELRATPFYSNAGYLDAFLKHVTRRSDASSRRAIPASLKSRKKNVDQWLDEPNKERHKYFFLKVVGLQKAMSTRFGPNWKSEKFPGKANIPEKDLLDHLGIENSGTNPSDDASKQILLTALLKQTFYPALKGPAKEAASIGHKLEEPLCHKLFQQVPNLKAAFQAPLVEKRGERWVKASADFLTIVDDGLELEVTEIKTRTSVQTAGREYDRVNRVNALQHGTIDAMSPFLHDYIDSRAEALQLLHHSYTYDVKVVRQIVCSSHGEIISSIRVQFSDYIKEQYGKCLKEIKDLILPWGYDRTNDCIPEDVLQLALTSPLKDLVGGWFGLVQQFVATASFMSPSTTTLTLHYT